MKQIVLLTDFGLNDVYVGILKGEILSITSQSNTIDLTHSISQQNIRQAAFVLSKSLLYFPTNIVYCGIVAPNIYDNKSIIIVQNNDTYFVAPNNGLLSDIISEKSKIFYLKEDYFIKNKTYHNTYILGKISAEISIGNEVVILGDRISAVDISIINISETNRIDEIKGEIINIDYFGNVVTNINTKWLDNYKYLYVEGMKIEKKFMNYENAPKNELFLYEGEFDTIEIAIRNDNVNKILKVKIGEEVILKKKDSD